MGSTLHLCSIEFKGLDSSPLVLMGEELGMLHYILGEVLDASGVGYMWLWIVSFDRIMPTFKRCMQ